jgi:hypothetical protein
MSSFRSLDAQEIVQTLERLQRRISERFPGSGLSKVAAEVLAVARENAERVRSLQRSNRLLQALIVAIVAGAVTLVVVLLRSYLAGRVDWTPHSGAELAQGLEACIGVVVFLGAAVIFLLTLDVRWKRGRALRAIHELRSLAHIVDMHQLTKDPDRIQRGRESTPSSPTALSDAFLLGRYLDYCSELLALIAKVGALYAQSFDDPVAIAAVDEIEDLTNGLSRKIWQKLTILDRIMERAPDAGGAGPG